MSLQGPPCVGCPCLFFHLSQMCIKAHWRGCVLRCTVEHHAAPAAAAHEVCRARMCMRVCCCRQACSRAVEHQQHRVSRLLPPHHSRRDSRGTDAAAAGTGAGCPAGRCAAGAPAGGGRCCCIAGGGPAAGSPGRSSGRQAGVADNVCAEPT